jgi:hypothetical protein
MSTGFPPDFPIPLPPSNPPLMLFYERVTGPTDSELRYWGTEVDIVRAHLTARNLINGGNVIRVLLLHGVQEIMRPDRDGS